MSALLALAVALASAGPGLVRVPYGSGQPPTLSCSVAYGCEIVLAPGERVAWAGVFDDRWDVRVADDGATGNAPRLVVSPSDAFEGTGRQRRPLRTNVTILTQPPLGREYVVVLTATNKAEIHRLGFTYADQPAVIVRVPAPFPAAAATAGESALLDPAAMDLGWKASGDPLVRPISVFSTRGQLWCRIPSWSPGVPAAYRIEGKNRIPLTSHTVAGRWLVVDDLASPIELDIGTHGATVVRDRE